MVPRRRPLNTVSSGLVAGALALALIALAPWPRSLRDHSSGDPALAVAAREALGTEGRDRLAVAYLPPGGSPAGGLRSAGFGADARSVFEVGSVSKAFTGMLFADAIERGEITADTTLGDVFGQRAGESAAVTLEQLATHSSGLPRLARGTVAQEIESFTRNLVRLDPYVLDREQLLAVAARTTPDTAREPTYSNFGFALLGQALVEVTGTDYPTLVAERIVEPLGLQDTYVPPDASGVREGDVRGRGANGLPTAAWTLDAQAPAGAVRSSVQDLATLGRAVQDGSAPGADSARPRADLDAESRIGWAWITQEMPGIGAVTWHNGGTGGFSSILGFTPDGAVVAVLANTQDSVDAGLELLAPGSVGAGEGS
ncbi:serine hydrolase domain-containing protein [Brevibacterium litoralis]|uniref:serine hydrolase domain-containing protein n=1 Tax=Brevibacterium litoralis TaxID=3138935 RepID=UPI0032EBB267